MTAFDRAIDDVLNHLRAHSVAAVPFDGVECFEADELCEVRMAGCQSLDLPHRVVVVRMTPCAGSTMSAFESSGLR